MINEHTTLPTGNRPVNSLEWVKNSYPSKIFEKQRALINSNNLILSALETEVYDELRPHLETVCLAGGEYIYQPSDNVDFLYFPETAVVSEFQILEDGRTIEIAMTGSEGLLGLLPLFHSGLAANWTQTSVSGTATRISRRALEKKIARFPDLQKLLLEYVSDYVRQISQRSVCNSYHVIEQRFCSWLLMIQDRKKGNKIPLTQEQIARSLGVHRPSLTHIAQNLRSKNIIDYVRGRIYILDRVELENAACACFSEMCRAKDVH